MQEKRALIVDDSKTAQIRLRRMLEHYQLVVDTASSAEEALSYLAYRSPAVVFMDHMMPGMDGFEAIKVIKSNPNTAMIPIIMYTSKSGDLYVGQARALGAIDVLSKDIIEQSSLDNVLRVINILPKGEQAETEEPPTATSVVEQTMEPAVTAEQFTRDDEVPTGSFDDAGLESPDYAEAPELPAAGTTPDWSQEPITDMRQVASLVESSISRVRMDITEQNQVLFKRVLRELKMVKSSLESVKPEEKPEFVPTDAAIEQQTKSPVNILNIVAAVLLAFIAVQVTRIAGQQSESGEQVAQLQNRVEQQLEIQQGPVGVEDAVTGAIRTAQMGDLISAIEWGINLKNQFGYDEQALGDDRLATVQELVSRLYEANFNGIVRLSVHHGDFCLTPNAKGDFELPAAGSSVQSCQFLSTQGNDFKLQDQMSKAFVNFLVSSPLLSEDGIQIEMQSNGLGSPKYRYPEPTVTAESWNGVAQLNNRVEFEILPHKG